MAREPQPSCCRLALATPDRAGICLELIRRPASVVPIFGVCLGHQAIGQAYGGDVVRAPPLMHGKLSKIHHTGKGVFTGLQDLRGDALPFADRRPGSLPDFSRSPPRPPTASSWACGTRRYPVHGVQFHPESIASEHGHQLLANFLEARPRGRRTRGCGQQRRGRCP